MSHPPNPFVTDEKVYLKIVGHEQVISGTIKELISQLGAYWIKLNEGDKQIVVNVAHVIYCRYSK